MRRPALIAIALASLLAFALLSAHLADGHGLYHFEHRVLRSVESPSSVGAWGALADRLATPVIIVVLVLAFAFGALRGSVLRIAVYAGLAGITFLISEHIAKPLVHETYMGLLTFPSGTVTAVCATVVATWLALYPLLRRWARIVTFLLGVSWVLLTSVAVVAARWHTPFDALGSVLLSLGVITAGAAVFERTAPQEPSVSDDSDESPSEADDDGLTSDVSGARETVPT